MDTVYRVVLEFEAREDAESCLNLLANWEYEDMTMDFDPPENPFTVYSIEELIRLVKESE